MDIKEKELLEAKADRDRFKVWAGEELFNRFMKIKDRLKSPLNDMTYWTSTREPKTQLQLRSIIMDEEEKIEKKSKEAKLIEEGAEILYEDDKWYVYYIKNFEACQKYGAGTKWCITGKNMEGEETYGRRYWDSYTRDGNQFYFFLRKGSNEKFAVMIDESGEHTIFDPRDREIPYIEGAPKVDKLPDVSENNPKYDRDEEEMEDEDQEPAAPPAPPPFNLEPVQNPQALQFRATTLEDALRQFNNAEKVADLRQELFAVKIGENKFTIFVFNGREAGPLLTQRGPGQFAMVTFDNPEVLTTWFQENMANVQVQDQAEANQPQPANEAVEEKEERHEVAHKLPINTLQRMIDNAKLDFIVVYQHGDNQVLPTNKKFLDKDGKLIVEDGLMLVDYENVEDGEIIAEGAQEVVEMLKEWEVLSDLNATEEMLSQVKAWLKETFEIEMKESYHEAIRLLYIPKEEKMKEAAMGMGDGEPEPVILESNDSYYRLRTFKVR